MSGFRCAGSHFGSAGAKSQGRASDAAKTRTTPAADSSERDRVELLHRLGREVELRRLVVVATYRTDEVVADSPSGNPLFAHELVHTLIEEGRARLIDGRWEGRGLEPAPLPVAVRELVDRRLLRLGEPSRGVLAAASVLGREFEYGLLRRAVTTPERGVLDALDDAIGSFLIEETANGYRFRHDLVREAVYRGLIRARRQQLHRSVGTALAEDIAAEGVDAEQVGYHFASSDEAWRAVPYLHEAARKAASVFANEHAIALYEQALSTTRSGPVDRAQRAALLEERGDLKSRVGDAPASVRPLKEALALFAEMEDQDSVLRVQGKAALGLVVLGQLEAATELLGAHLESWRELIGEEFGHRFSSLGTAAAFRAWPPCAGTADSTGRHGRRPSRRCRRLNRAGTYSSGPRAYESLALACHALGDWEKGVEYELSREALGVGRFETDVVLDGHL